ncbi:MAG: hypothetical protein WAL75_24535 [Terracidiphilus sp.]
MIDSIEPALIHSNTTQLGFVHHSLINSDACGALSVGFLLTQKTRAVVPGGHMRAFARGCAMAFFASNQAFTKYFCG